jgi:hypothetical protein
VARSLSAFVYPVTTDEGWQLFFALPAANWSDNQKKTCQISLICIFESAHLYVQCQRRSAQLALHTASRYEGEIGMDFNAS